MLGRVHTALGKRVESGMSDSSLHAGPSIAEGACEVTVLSSTRSDIRRLLPLSSEEEEMAVAAFTFIILLITANITASRHNISGLTSEHFSCASTLNDRLPNPYHVPQSSIALDFWGETSAPPLSKAIILALLDRARDDTMLRIIMHGNIPIASGSQQIQYGSEVFVYESTNQGRKMKYGEVLSVIKGFMNKEILDGFKHRLATVLYTDDDGRTVETGEAGVLRRAGMVDDVQ
ncbi:MAG: hypothetical protein Q9219_005832 [cf. Caloplaca sp. 3 TL-2023]